MKKMTFEEFYNKFIDQYQMTETDHEGNIEYSFLGNTVKVSPASYLESKGKGIYGSK